MTIKDLYDLAVENGFEYDEVFICVEDDFFKHRFKLNENMINLSEDDVSIEVYVQMNAVWNLIIFVLVFFLGYLVGLIHEMEKEING